MKSLKKLLAIVLSFAMVIGLWSTSAFATIPIDDGGNASLKNILFYDGGTALTDISISAEKDTVITLPTYSKTGYEFNGWKLNGSETIYQAGDTYTVEDDESFYAQLTAGETVATVTIEGKEAKSFPTFDEARIYALTANDIAVTITLYNDVTLSERLPLRNPDSTDDTIARNITFDLNGYTMTKGATMNGFFIINEGTTLTFKNGTLDCATYGGYFVYGNNNSYVNIESGTYKGYSPLMSQNVSLTITGGAFEKAPYSEISSQYTIEKNADSLYEVVEKTGSDVISLSDGSTTFSFDTIEHMQVALDYYDGSYNQIALLKNCTVATRIALPEASQTTPITYTLDLAGYTLTYSGSSNGFVIIRAYDSFTVNDSEGGGAVTNTSTKSYYFADNKNAGTITINAGTYTGASKFVYDNSTTTVKLVINESSWNIDPTAYVDTANYEIAQSGDLYVVSRVTQAEAMWQINGATYNGTYEEAIKAAAAASSATIKLLQDCSQSSTWAFSNDITIDLNGHVLTSAGQFATVSGALTIKDTSEGQAGYLTTSSTNAATFIDISSGATVTLASGGIANFKTTSSSAQVIKNAGKFYMTGGFISGITTSNRRILQGNKSTSKIYLSGGVISGNSVGTGYDVFIYYGSCEISNEFMLCGALGKGSSTSTTISITGGWFKTQPTSSWIATGYSWVADSSTHEGYAGYVANAEAAKVAEVTIDGTATKYETFDKAMAAAAAITSGSATVTLLKNCEKTAKVTTIASGTTVTLDLNGKNLTNTYTNSTLSSTNHRYFTVAGTLNITDSVGGGTITANAEYTGNASITFAQATGKIYIDNGIFFTGDAQTATSNIAFSRATGGTYHVTGGWYTDKSYCATYTESGYGKVTVSDAPNADAPITVSNTTKTFTYNKNAAAATGSVDSSSAYYLDGYTSTDTLNAKTNQFTNPGYNFMGWSTDKNADPDSPDLIAAGDLIDWQSSTYGATNTLYAIWKQVSVDMWVCVNTNDPTQGWASIADAFAAGCTDVTLFKDYTTRDTISSGTGRLNLNGYNIIPNSADNPTGSALVIKRPISIYNVNAGTITVGGVDYNYGGDGRIEGYAQGTGGAIDASGDQALVKIYSGTFTGDAPNHGTVLTCSSGGQYYIYGGTFAPANEESTVSAYYTGAGKIFVLGGLSGAEGASQSDVKMSGTWETYSATSGTVGIAGGNFSEVPAPAAGIKVGTWDASGGAIVEDSTLAIKKAASDENFPYMVASANAVAITEDGTIYDSFAEALEAAKTQENPEITVCDNIDEEGVAFTYDVTLNMNGYNIVNETDVNENVVLNISNCGPNTLLTSSGFVYIDGVLTTSGIVSQVKTAERVEYVGGTINDTLGATFYGLVALKPGDSMPVLTYVDPITGERVDMNTTTGANGLVTYDLSGIYVYYIANDLLYQFEQDGSEIGEAESYSLLDYYNDCYAENHSAITGGTPDAKLDALLADTLVYAHELQLMSGKGTSFTLPEWVATAKTSYIPTASDNVAKTSVSAVDATNYKITSGSVNVTSKAGLMFTIHATEKVSNELKLVVSDGTSSNTYVLSRTAPSEGVEYLSGYMYCVRVDKISPVSYGTIYSAVLYVGGTAYHGVDYSINSYCYRMYQKTDVVGSTTTGAIALALYNFGKAAVAYQG